MSKDLVALELRDRSNADVATAFRFIVDKLLGFLQDALSSGEAGPEHERLYEEVVRNRAALANAEDQRSVGTLVEPLLRLSQVAFDHIKAERAATRTEMTSIVGLVRDAVTVITGEDDVFSASVTDSLQRFDQLRSLTDIHQLKARLEREVTGLKDLVRQREERWRATVATFEQRVATLERQLTVSRAEASLDPLTGAGNRRAFDRALKKSLQPGQRQFVVAIVDLDDFKRINDTQGHEAGDAVLKIVAEALQASLRTEDMVARIGGDEFALIISGVTLMQVDSRLRSIVVRLAGTRVGPAESRFTVSCGAAECSAGDTAESIIRRADQALYDAKRQGKNRLVTRQTPLIRDLRIAR